MMPQTPEKNTFGKNKKEKSFSSSNNGTRNTKRNKKNNLCFYLSAKF